MLTSEFFLDDRRLLGGIRGRPNEQGASAFRAGATKAEELARRRLRIDAGNSEALMWRSGNANKTQVLAFLGINTAARGISYVGVTAIACRSSRSSNRELGC